MKHKKPILASILVIAIAGAIVLLWVTNQPAPVKFQYEVKVAFPNLSFDRPVGIYNPGDHTNRLFVLEKTGLIYVFENTENVTAANIFLDIRDRVNSAGYEEGLLGMAFHPDFAGNGFFYLDYTASNPLRTVIARFTVSEGNPNQADKNSELVILEVLQPYENHNGGQLAFGPDGNLYIALGDGGSEGDPHGNGQNRSTLLGKILRINIDGKSASANYTIPNDNPFVGNAMGYREEIYAYGLRNPWRFSFDPVTEWLWAGDVGQDRIEEIDVIEKGKNYGWNITEGNLCFSPPENCNRTGLEPPIWSYNHTLGDAVTGGFVYRGSALTELVGSYIYGDFGSGRVWALRYDGVKSPVNEELVDTDLNIASFGIDEKNELYICAFDGKIYELIHSPISP